MSICYWCVFFFKQKTAYEMRISDWSSDVCSSDLVDAFEIGAKYNGRGFDLNVTAFHQVFDDFQLNTFNGLFFEVANVNACKDDLGGADTDNDPTTRACPGGVQGGVKRKIGRETCRERVWRDV